MFTPAVRSVQATLDCESDAMRHLAQLYRRDEDALTNLDNVLQILHETHVRGGKIVSCGIGKSFKIATKTTATLKSLLIAADVLHPSEALHGDLGLLHDRDAVVFFTASGNTPELLNLLPHMPPVPIVLLTCTRHLALSRHPQVTGLLYAELPDHLQEKVVHGVPAPTILAALSLALADAVALALAEMVTKDVEERRLMFSRKHPGGAIGEAARAQAQNKIEKMSIADQKVDVNVGAVGTSRQPKSKKDVPSLLTEESILTHTLLSDKSIERLPEKLAERPSANSSSSYASLLSLTQLTSARDADTSTSSSLSSSDCEEPLANSRVFARSAALRWSEVEFLRIVALYDVVILTDSGATLAAECLSLRAWYRLAEWTGMAEPLKLFRNVYNQKKERAKN